MIAPKNMKCIDSVSLYLYDVEGVMHRYDLKVYFFQGDTTESLDWKIYLIPRKNTFLKAG